MVQSELSKKISKRINLPKYHIDRVLEAMKGIVTEELVNGNEVSLRGFCTFWVADRKNRKGYNPTTGNYEEYEAMKTARCKMGIPVKRAVKEGIVGDLEEYDDEL